MAEVPIEIEIDRVTNIIKGFGWEVRERKVLTGEIQLLIFKKVATKAVETPT